MGILKLKDLKNKRVHFIGIGGISMSGLAQILIKEKIYVQGSDESFNDEVLRLKNLNVLVFGEHKKSNVKDIDVVVYSSAISEDNPELIYAKKKGLVILKRAELLGVIATGYKTVISVAGSHGKTTTSAMIAEVLIDAGLKPTIHLGGVLNRINSNTKIGNKKIFLTESCEYKDNYLYIHPDLSIILNIDADHLDYFYTLKGVQDSFYRFLQNTKVGGLNIVNGDDINSINLQKNADSVCFGLKNGQLIAKNIKEYKNGYYSFDAVFEEYVLGNVELNILGEHNIYNALATIFVGLLCGVDFCKIKKSIENFSGTKRRTEFVGNIEGVIYYHDYAHHPKQIKQMVDIGKKLAKDGKLIVVFEPHTFSRTKYLIDEFVESFTLVDKLIIAPVYSAREREEQGFNSNDLLKKVLKKNIDAELISGYKNIKSFIFKIKKAGDVVLILGAGSVEKLAKMIKEKDYD